MKKTLTTDTGQIPFNCPLEGEIQAAKFYAAYRAMHLNVRRKGFTLCKPLQLPKTGAGQGYLCHSCVARFGVQFICTV